MDLQQLQERALRAREFTHTIGKRSFNLRIPTRDESLLEARRMGSSLREDLAGMLLLQSVLLRRAITGWEGLTVGDVLRESPEAPEAAEVLPFHADAIALVLDANPDWSRELSRELAERTAARNERIETEAKN